MPSWDLPASGTHDVSRRDVLAAFPAVLFAAASGKVPLSRIVPEYTLLQQIDPSSNPLETYPNRDWEQVYRDLYTPDSTFHWMCGPNDTHGCLLKANVKNGVVVYADPSFGYGKATDKYGNQASQRWDPRACVSGLAYVRRAYSDRRIKGAYVRENFKQWVDDGFPRDADGQPPARYREGRGKESFVKVTHEDAASLVAKTYVNIATTYSGEEGADLLEPSRATTSPR